MHAVRGTAALAAASVVLGATGAAAQEKHKYFFQAPPATTRYTQQHIIDVGDVPGHQLRVAELQAKYTTEAPVFDGVKVTAVLSRLISDYSEPAARRPRASTGSRGKRPAHSGLHPSMKGVIEVKQAKKRPGDNAAEAE